VRLDEITDWVPGIPTSISVPNSSDESLLSFPYFTIRRLVEMAMHLASRKSRLALAAGSGVDLLALAAVALLYTLELLANLLDTGSAGARDIGSVAVVGVDANEVTNALGLDVLDDNVARATVIGAVTAPAVEFAGVNNGEALNGNGTTAVMLDDLVLGLLSTATLNQSIAVAKDRDGIYIG
jgi:hypothetical protein